MRVDKFKDEIESYAMSIIILLVLVGGIYLSGWIAGVHWEEYWIDFSWTMFNSEQIKQLVNIK
ncbi:hypothetical protein [Halobacillus mangrovi]|uniref:DNA-directed RNA polymerase subunit beta n=1 Tax=Halobacillus mangrovi TaxID=402384 RepID=A0A1W5ZW84_9BACI|nr:hypothetical protein [Halobacillus mangrovi]ARI77540.1 hypothetical protein HM131_12100 [Halobacillus mangrovi]